MPTPFDLAGLSVAGSLDWTPVKDPVLDARPMELPIVTEHWNGREDAAAAWQALYAIGKLYQPGTPGSIETLTEIGDGIGYIIDNTPHPFDECMSEAELKVALAPPVGPNDYLDDPDSERRTIQISATVADSTIIKGDTSVTCVRTVVAICYQTRYRYFSLIYPAGPRFSGVVGGTPDPIFIRSSIVCTGVQSGQVVNLTKETAPAGIVSATTMALGNVLASAPKGQRIKGTPWYECEEVWSYEYIGDAS